MSSWFKACQLWENLRLQTAWPITLLWWEDKFTHDKNIDKEVMSDAITSALCSVSTKCLIVDQVNTSSLQRDQILKGTNSKFSTKCLIVDQLNTVSLKRYQILTDINSKFSTKCLIVEMNTASLKRYQIQKGINSKFSTSKNDCGSNEHCFVKKISDSNRY